MTKEEKDEDCNASGSGYFLDKNSGNNIIEETKEPNGFGLDDEDFLEKLKDIPVKNKQIERLKNQAS